VHSVDRSRQFFSTAISPMAGFTLQQLVQEGVVPKSEPDRGESRLHPVSTGPGAIAGPLPFRNRSL
jgi:hypothetical protein